MLRDAGQLLVPVEVKLEEFTQGGLCAEVSEQALYFAQSLFAIEVSEAKASKPYWGEDDGSWEMSVKSHAV